MTGKIKSTDDIDLGVGGIANVFEDRLKNQKDLENVSVGLHPTRCSSVARKVRQKLVSK